MPYLSPTSPAKAKSITAPRGNISDRCWHNVMGISPRCGSHKAAPIASKKILWKHIQISALQIVKRDLHSVSLCVSSKDYLLLWLGGSIIISLHISWRIGCQADFRSCSCSLGCEFASRITNSAHRLPTKRRACPV